MTVRYHLLPAAASHSIFSFIYCSNFCGAQTAQELFGRLNVYSVSENSEDAYYNLPQPEVKLLVLSDKTV